MGPFKVTICWNLKVIGNYSGLGNVFKMTSFYSGSVFMNFYIFTNEFWIKIFTVDLKGLVWMQMVYRDLKHTGSNPL